jgi:membrane associated rhomboid family serine protease
VLPIQDAVPSGGVPRATLALILLNLAAFAAERLFGLPVERLLVLALAPLLHPSGLHFVVAMLFLWLFGDNVEARIGRGWFVALYIASAAAGIYVALRVTGDVAPVGAACGVSGILGAYFVLLPNSRILVLVPVPFDLAETPALFFLGVWWLVHVVSFVSGPWAAPALLWPLAAAFVLGAAACRMTRPRVVW